MSTKYIHFTNEEKERARKTDIAEILHAHGELLKHSGTEYEWRSGTQKITIRGHVWFDHYEHIGGDAISFVQKFFNKSFPEAVTFLLGKSGGELYPMPRKIIAKRGAFSLPKRNENTDRVFTYLTSFRGIACDVVRDFECRGMIYESEKYHNAVFVGFDSNGDPAHASLRGIGHESDFKGSVPNSSPEFSFHWLGQDNALYLFESPIDMLSYITMHKNGWKKHSYAACCGVSNHVLVQMLCDNANLDTVVLCLDNDEVGQSANTRMAKDLVGHGIQVEILVPIHKDWNEDLLYSNESEDESECQALQL